MKYEAATEMARVGAIPILQEMKWELLDHFDMLLNNLIDFHDIQCDI